jgi:DNA-binding SARP family transcriptional activator
MFRFYLFGRFEVHWQQQPLAGFEPKKVQELFAFLATHRHRSHSRELVADLLWVDFPLAATKKNMRQTLWQLQTALNMPEPGNEVLLVDNEFLSLNPQANIFIDIERFESVANSVQDIPGVDLTEAQASAISEVIDLYRADFLEGWYVDWCLHERERFHNLFLTVLDKLVLFYETHGEYETAVHYCNQALRKEYVRECTHRQLMRLYYLSGDRTAAIRQYERCKAALADALSVVPGQLTQNLYEYICADNKAGVMFNGQAISRATAKAESFPELINYLLEMKSMIEVMELQVLKQLQNDTS